MLRLILIGFCVWFIYRAIRNWMFNANRQRPQVDKNQAQRREFIEELVQDPQCQTYLPRSDALRARINGKEVYFCSEKCRDEYLAGRNR